MSSRRRPDAHGSAAQHRLREVDPDQASVVVEHRQFEAGADADIEHGAAWPRRCRSRRAAALPHDELEGEIVDRGPTGISRLDMGVFDRRESLRLRPHPA